MGKGGWQERESGRQNQTGIHSRPHFQRIVVTWPVWSFPVKPYWQVYFYSPEAFMKIHQQWLFNIVAAWVVYNSGTNNSLTKKCKRKSWEMRCPCGTFKSLNIFLAMKKVMHMHWAMHTEEALGYHFWLILRPCTSSKLDLRQNCQLSGRAGKASLNTYTETLGKKKNRGDLPPSSY